MFAATAVRKIWKRRFDRIATKRTSSYFFRESVAAILARQYLQAAVVAAPGLGFSIGPHGLGNVSAPIQLWSADQDINVPYATNTRLVREALGPRVEFYSVPGAGHFSFLAPCGLLRPAGICSDPGQFDRKAFHANMNASVVAFFEGNMKRVGH